MALPLVDHTNKTLLHPETTPVQDPKATPEIPDLCLQIIFKEAVAPVYLVCRQCCQITQETDVVRANEILEWGKDTKMFTYFDFNWSEPVTQDNLSLFSKQLSTLLQEHLGRPLFSEEWPTSPLTNIVLSRWFLRNRDWQERLSRIIRDRALTIC